MVKRGVPLIAPYDNDDVLTGQGTACFEAIEDAGAPDAVFAHMRWRRDCSRAPGLQKNFWRRRRKSGVGSRLLGNDAVQSLKAGHIVRLKGMPRTVADGAMTMSVAERTFEYLKKINGILEVEEEPCFTGRSGSRIC